jgi:hypothetical protein
MAHKLTRKQSEKLRQLVREEISESRKKRKFDWKYWVATGLALLGLLLGAISLRARPTVALESPLDSRNVLSTPIVISNDGMMALRDVEVASFVIQAGYQNHDLEMGSIGSSYTPPGAALESGERETVLFEHFFREDRPIIQADIALIVTFSPEFLPFFRRTRVFRFSTARQANGTLSLEHIPAADAFEKYRKVIDEVKGIMNR